MSDSQTTTALISAGSALFGALVGGGVALAVEMVLMRGTQETRERERRYALDDIQRQTLMDLQDAFGSWAVTIGEVDAAHLRAQVQGVAFMNSSDPDLERRELPERLVVDRLIGRVRDRKTREAGREVFRTGLTALMAPITYEQAHASVDSFQAALVDFQETLSADLRQYL